MKVIAVTIISLSLASCISTQEMPIAPNVVRIDTSAKGLLFTGQAVPQTMRAAANATLARGYSHFKFADVVSQQGSEAAGVIATSSPSIATVSVTHANTATTGATVIMFHADELGAKDAFNAQEILRQYPQ